MVDLGLGRFKYSESSILFFGDWQSSSVSNIVKFHKKNLRVKRPTNNHRFLGSPSIWFLSLFPFPQLFPADPDLHLFVDRKPFWVLKVFLLFPSGFPHFLRSVLTLFVNRVTLCSLCPKFDGFFESPIVWLFLCVDHGFQAYLKGT